VSSGTEVIEVNGQKIPLLLQESPPEFHALFSSKPAKVIPSSEIRDFDLWPQALKIKNQGTIGACNGFASATAVEYTRAMHNLPYVRLSPWWVYGKLVGGWDTGSNIGQALDLIRREGVAPDHLVKQGDFSGRYSNEAVAEAAKYKVEIGSKLTTWDEILTAVALRRGVNFSVRASGWDSGRLDADGCPPVGRMGPHNHAVFGGGGIKTTSRGERLIRMANSWDVRWGDRGFCWISRAHFEEGWWREAFEVVITRATAA
jgi:hypothetical protein